MKKVILEKYEKIENKILPLLNYIHEKYSSDSLYKGYQTLNGSIIENCEILFLGINPGEGAYRENLKHKINEKPAKIALDAVNIDWFKDGNARGYWNKEEEKWYAFKWYQRNIKKQNNPFVRNMIDVLYELARIKDPNDFENYEREPDWFNQWGNKIILSNICPISTKNRSHLDKLLVKLTKDTEVQKILNNININKWDIYKYFLQYIADIIKLTKPKVVVCMGKTAYDLFHGYLKTKVIKNKPLFISKGRIDSYEFPVIGFSRRGYWVKNKKTIAESVIEYMNTL